MIPVNAIIKEVIKETPTISTLKFDIKPDAIPGQFVMVWIRGVDEIPMALSHPNGITVQNVGDASETLSNMEPGDSIGLRGPFGNGFELSGQRIMIIAGGVGAAPLLPLAHQLRLKGTKISILLGAKTSKELLFEEQFSRSGEINVATDDGSKGYHGVITGLMDTYDLNSFDMFYVCGPEMMMRAVLDMLHTNSLESISQFSLHRYFKCGIGVCGSCTIDPSGLRVCKDGPIFYGNILLNSELGKYHRDVTGKKIMF